MIVYGTSFTLIFFESTNYPTTDNPSANKSISPHRYICLQGGLQLNNLLYSLVTHLSLLQVSPSLEHVWQTGLFTQDQGLIKSTCNE